MASQAHQPPKRIFSLDVLRGLACTLVLVGHMPIDYGQINSVVGFAIGSVRRCGWLGVDLFFVLSGLLISGLLFKEIQARGSINYRRFWLRRGMKIWPSYFAAFGLMIVARILDSRLTGAPHDLHKLYSSILPNSIFLQNYLECWRWPHSWSIAVEEHFYTLLPLVLIYLVAAGRLDRLPKAVIGVCSSVLVLRLIAAAGGASWEEIKYPTHYHIDALLFGVLLGYLFAYHPARLEALKRWWPTACAASVAIFVIVGNILLKANSYVYALGFTVIYLAFGSLVLMARLHPNWGTRGPAWLRAVTGLLAFIGVYSYTIYLAHGVVFKLPILSKVPRLVDHPAWAPSTFVLGSVLGGILLAHLVERPFLSMRDRWIPSAGKAQARAVLLPMTDSADDASRQADHRRAA